MKTIIVKNQVPIKEKRVCLNCGTDISHKRRDAKFCCSACYNGFHGIDYEQSKKDMYLFNAN